jgi:hypothetical protein
MLKIVGKKYFSIKFWKKSVILGIKFNKNFNFALPLKFLPPITTSSYIFSYLSTLYVRHNQKSAQESQGKWRNFPFST